MSEHLKAFYRAYVAWLDKGAPDKAPFDRRDGLCLSIANYLRAAGVSEGRQLSAFERLNCELSTSFSRAGLYHAFPFGGGNAYHRELADATMHLNEQRIAWAREHAK